MTTYKKIDIVNFFLIWVVLWLAYAFPFQLFLFSYAVLGPLHYLTEINWLEKKNYFLKNPNDKKTYLLVVIAVLSISATAFFIPELAKWDFTKAYYYEISQSSIYKPLSGIIDWGHSVLFIGLFSTIIYYITDKWINRVLLLCLCIVISIFLIGYPFFTVVFGVFLPSIVHVFIFTVLFMWSGAKRSKSGWGYINVVSLLFVIFIIINNKIPSSAITIDQSTLKALIASNFDVLLFEINRLLGLGNEGPSGFYSPNVWKIQIFIAFSYTYHYMNWFSKTTVINWHQVNKTKMTAAIIIWIASIILYYINYRLGLAALFVLSALHVILEFPLNISSIMSLVKPTHKNKDINTIIPSTSTTKQKNQKSMKLSSGS
ncbi:MAG: hypothetical protein HYZ54_10435 [Ignavibacteriae bacterium]|nr:hypothetical protein [Ignavibacteriota bacterium]